MLARSKQLHARLLALDIAPSSVTVAVDYIELLELVNRLRLPPDVAEATIESGRIIYLGIQIVLK